MTTRSIVGSITPDGPVAVYCHYDGYPEHQVSVLRKLIERDGAETAARLLLEHTKTGGGWSVLDTRDRPYASLGERGEVVPGYGIAYRDAETELITLDQWKGGTGRIEYAYFIDPATGDIHCYDRHDDFKLTVHPAAENGSKS